MRRCYGDVTSKHKVNTSSFVFRCPQRGRKSPCWGFFRESLAEKPNRINNDQERVRTSKQIHLRIVTVTKFHKIVSVRHKIRECVTTLWIIAGRHEIRVCVTTLLRNNTPTSFCVTKFIVGKKPLCLHKYNHLCIRLGAPRFVWERVFWTVLWIYANFDSYWNDKRHSMGYLIFASPRRVGARAAGF